MAGTGDAVGSHPPIDGLRSRGNVVRYGGPTPLGRSRKKGLHSIDTFPPSGRCGAARSSRTTRSVPARPRPRDHCQIPLLSRAATSGSAACSKSSASARVYVGSLTS